MHPMHPTIKAYIVAAQGVHPREERARIALAASRPGKPSRPSASNRRRRAALDHARRVRKILTTRNA